jgi:hypothetical protein
MKKILIFILLLTSTISFAQNEVVEDTTAQPAITAAGKPTGKIKEMMMNKDGGTLVSGDGLLELIIPSGALSKKTTISIQPITNMIPNGNGQAYRLEPSGIQFQKPVQLIFHYDEEETKDNMQLLLGIAMQDDKGQWLGLNKSDLDTTAKTISGSIHHFSVWSSFSELKIDPGYARVKINKAKGLTITNVSASPASSGDDDLLSPLNKKIPGRAIWHANEILNGNSAVGTISAAARTFANYKAPAQVPVKNPVAVTATLLGFIYKTKIRGQIITFENLKLVSNILVYDDAYEVTMISEMQDASVGNLGPVNYKDTGSFVVSLNGREARIIERVNRNMASSLSYEAGICCTNYKVIKNGTGNIHIAGTPVVKVTPPSAPGKSAIVEIRFSRVPAIFPTFQVTCLCPGERGAPITSTNARGIVMMANFLAAQPEYVKFEAKEGEQTILVNGQPGGPIYSKFTVKQIKED